jgi:hypothetical protein
MSGLADVDGADEFGLILFLVIGQAIRELGYEGLRKQQWTRANDRAVMSRLLPLLKQWGFQAKGGYGLQFEFQGNRFRAGTFEDFLRERGK